MKTLLQLALVVLVAPGLTARARSGNLDELKVLYIGDVGAPRAQQFTGFLSKNVGRVDAASRKDFRPVDADDFDVVLLDWPQSEKTREEWQAGRSPLGNRAAWSKPTVLLGSAGLNLAVVWKVRGGSG
jgi:hypothetical protein